MKKKTLGGFLLIIIIFLGACTIEDTPIGQTSNTFTVSTTVEGQNYYQGLILQMGLSGSTEVLEESVIDNSGKAVYNTDFTKYVGENIWFGVPKMVKFFHTLTNAEVAGMTLRLPDKDGGSTLDATGLGNDWIVALYMGVNKDGNSDIPIYWATGNLMAVKTNGSGEASEVAYHIADAAETESEGLSENGLVGVDDRLVANVIDSYANMPKGSKWDMYSFGDKTGLMLYDMNKHKEYSIDAGLMSEDLNTIYYDISGDARFDAARAQLGGLWRIPTCGKSGNNEFAAFEDDCEEYAEILPNGHTYGESLVTSYGMEYEYSIVVNGQEITINKLRLPASGYRHANRQYGAKGRYCLYWSSTADPTGTIPYTPGGSGWAEGRTFPKWFTAFNYGWLEGKKSWFPHPRTSGQAIRPVTE